MADPVVEVSIIVRCFNEQKHLAALFDGLSRQSLISFETIVVDSGSFDRSREIANAHADQVIQISSHDFTFGYSLNVGIAAARGRYIAIISAHAIPADEHWLERLVAPLRETGVAMCYGRQIGEACSKFSEAEDFDRVFGPHPRIESVKRWCVNNANSVIRRDLWEQHPFDEELTGLEDIEFASHWMNRGWKVQYCPDACVIHIHEESWHQIHRRYYREAVALRRMNLKSAANIPAELLVELGRAFSDCRKAFMPGTNPVAERLSLGQRLREILYFRFHKCVGTVTGLMESHPMESQSERERILFDRSALAVVVHGPGKAELQAVPVPALKPGDVLIRVAHVGVCGTDREIFNGTLGYFANGLGTFPIIPGHEFSGTVITTGQNVQTLAEGDSVTAECIQSCGTCGECRAGNFIGCLERTELGVLRRDGAYAEYVVVPARFVHKLPVDMNLRAGALVEPLAVVLKGLRRIRDALHGGPRRCAVLGAGAIGHFAALALAERGHAISVFDSNPTRLADIVSSDITTRSDLGGLDEFDVIIEATGNPDALDRAIHESRAGTVLLLLGLPYARKEFSFEVVAAYDKTVVGSVGSTKEDFEQAIALLPRLSIAPFVSTSVPLADYRKAWTMAERGEALKILLDVG